MWRKTKVQKKRSISNKTLLDKNLLKTNEDTKAKIDKEKAAFPLSSLCPWPKAIHQNIEKSALFGMDERKISQVISGVWVVRRGITVNPTSILNTTNIRQQMPKYEWCKGIMSIRITTKRNSKVHDGGSKYLYCIFYCIRTVCIAKSHYYILALHCKLSKGCKKVISPQCLFLQLPSSHPF